MKSNSTGTTIKIVGALLIVLLLGVTAMLIFEKKTNNELLQEMQLEKEDLESEYDHFARQYDELKLTVANDSLAALLEQEQLKTQRLLEELRTVKSSNAAEIRRLKKELSTLRKVMVGYINQIDSLNRLTAQQQAQITEVTRKYDDAARRANALSEEKTKLEGKVSLAAQLDASGLKLVMQNKRGKDAKKLKDAVRLRVEFSVAKNVTAPTGERTLYVCIVKPDNDVLTTTPDDTFAYENRQLTYSIKKYIEYNGEEQAVTVYWDVDRFMYSGTYRVDIFSDGALIGSEAFDLK